MDNRITLVDAEIPERDAPPVSYIPTPSAPYRRHRKAAALTLEPGRPRIGLGEEPASPFGIGTRVLMWKQDPSVHEIGTRKVFLPGLVLDGPRDARIMFGEPGIAPVSPNAFGDFVTMPDTPQFDAVHTYAVVRQTLTMYQRALADGSDDTPLPWQWNSSADLAPLAIHPYGLPNVMNAFYSRANCCLKFGDFVPAGQTQRVFTCRSLDIVAQTKARLHDKTFLADIAEEFGLALGRSNGLRNADNDITLSQAGIQVHAISQVFTGAIYDILADLFAFERNPHLRDCAAVLHEVGAYLRSLLLRAIIAAPDQGATYADVVNAMLRLAHEDGKPVDYRNAIRNRFVLREVVQSPVALTEDHVAGTDLPPAVQDAPDAVQDRSACCGTMNLAEYHDVERLLAAELEALAQWCATHGRAAPAPALLPEPAAPDDPGL